MVIVSEVPGFQEIVPYAWELQRKILLLLSAMPPLLACLAEQGSNGEGTGPWCLGCGHRAEMLDSASAVMLSRLEGRPRDSRAYICEHCQCIIFEEELVDGAFVPPQYQDERRDKSRAAESVSPRTDSDPRLLPAGRIGGLSGWDEEGGTMTYSLGNRRVFLVRGKAWRSMEDALYTNLRRSAAKMLFQAGLSYGYEAARDYAHVTGGSKDPRAYFEEVAAVAGWGKFELIGDLLSSQEMTVRVENCIFCRNGATTEARGARSCEFLRGVSKGIVDTVFSRPCRVSEEECGTRGSIFCTFRFTPETIEEPKR